MWFTLQSIMADQDSKEEEEEDGETEIKSPESMIEFQSPSPPSDHFNGGWSVVNNLEHPNIVFPPVNHEGLDHVSSAAASPHGDFKEFDVERVASPPPSSLPTPRPMMSTVGDAAGGGWWEAGLEVLRIKVAGIVSTFRKFAEAKGFPMSIQSRFGYFAPLAGSMMLLLLYLRFRRHRRMQMESVADLIRFSREKDEEKLQKINELLQQVTRMNELLLALASQHRSRAA